jgi:4-hydroxythreonine-4-phosphate dehydrogenase
MIGITVGDPAGIGPEVAAAAIAACGIRDIRLYGPDAIVAVVPGVIAVPASSGLAGVATGRYSPASGAASLAALEAAAEDLASGLIDALVTGPICKQALAEAGLPFPGQTEFVASRLGAERFAMMLAGPRLRVALATTHLALREVPDAITLESVRSVTRLTSDFLAAHFGIARPRLAVLGLNPHASDEGRFGTEEARVIRPAIDRLRADGVDASGPLPADTAFHRAAAGEFDAVVAMYHDQGLGPLKLLHFSDAINVTMGLPRVRCSPDHGPAFDLAGTGRADPASMIAALRFAARFAYTGKGGFQEDPG